MGTREKIMGNVKKLKEKLVKAKGGVSLKKLNGATKVFSNMGIRTKINVLIFGMVILFSAMLAVTIIRMNSFNKEYESVLENISMISYTKSNTLFMSKSIVNLCNFYGDVADSGYNEIVDNIDEYIDKIGENIGDEEIYAQNRYYYDNMKTATDAFVADYRSIIEVCGGETFSPQGNTYANDLASQAGFITTGADNLLSVEIIRSENLQESISKSQAKLVRVIVILAILVVVVMVLLGLAISASIATPLIGVNKRISVVAAGDLSGEDIPSYGTDEIGQLSLAFNTMKGNVSDILKEVLKDTQELKGAIGGVVSSMEENSQGSAKIATAIQAMNTKLEKQQSEVEKVVAQITEMDEISKSVIRSAERISLHADETMELASQGVTQLTGYVEQMKLVNSSIDQVSAVFEGFNKSAAHMSDALKTITDIATQTNLLSLNASIEAARAGEAGKGFAVVADEIRKLADDSQTAAKEIGAMISKIQDDSVMMNKNLSASIEQLERGNEMTAETQNNFRAISQGTEDVGNHVGAIREKLDRLSGKIDETVGSARLIDESNNENVVEINQISEIVTAESGNLESVSETSNRLMEMTAELESRVNEFKL